MLLQTLPPVVEDVVSLETTAMPALRIATAAAKVKNAMSAMHKHVLMYVMLRPNLLMPRLNRPRIDALYIFALTLPQGLVTQSKEKQRCLHCTPIHLINHFSLRVATHRLPPMK